MYNFTLIIPTHNRHNYLKRSIAYFKDLDAKVIYCDSSEIAYNGDLALNMEYLHLPGKRFANKILIALDKLETDFVALCADDDFILIESLYKGVSLLERNTNYQTLVGKYIAFNENFDGNFLKRYQELPSDIDFSPNKNAKIFFENYYQILWAMYNKGLIIKAFEIIKNAEFKNDNFIELTIGSCACYCGGIKFLNEIWGIRELNLSDHWGAKHSAIDSCSAVKKDNDFKKFKELLDKDTIDGYSVLILKSYLKSQQTIFIKIRKVLKKLIPKIILTIIQGPDRETNKLRNEIVDLSILEENQLSKISSLL